MNTKPAADDFPELVADLGHVFEPSGVGVEIEVTARPLSSPAHRIIAEHPHLVPLLVGTGDDYELIFVPQPDASPPMECLSPGLAPPVTATGAIETEAGMRSVDASRKPLSVTASGEQHL